MAFCETCVDANRTADEAISLAATLTEVSKPIRYLGGLGDRPVAFSGDNDVWIVSDVEVSASAEPEAAVGAGSKFSTCKHNFVDERCRICPQCMLCTGVGASCYRSSLPDKIAGALCGCGAGNSGCVLCGICKACDKAMQAQKDKSADASKNEAAKPGEIKAKELSGIDGLPEGSSVRKVVSGQKHCLILLNNGQVFGFGGELCVRDRV